MYSHIQQLFEPLREKNYSRSKKWEAVPAPCSKGTDWKKIIEHPSYGPEDPAAVYPILRPGPRAPHPSSLTAEDYRRRYVERTIIYGAVSECLMAQGYPAMPCEIVPAHVLQFEARYESGNLMCACWVGDNEYDLILAGDIPYHRTTQWYNFRVQNAVIGVTYKFNIINFTKPGSLYSHGLQPLCFSTIRAADKGSGWSRCGEVVSYFPNSWQNPSKKEGKRYHTLSWKFQVDYGEDTLYFSHCYPYTYTKLCTFLNNLMQQPDKAQMIVRKTLCTTQAGNDCEYLNVTQPVTSVTQLEGRRAIVLTARVHPGETNASYVMQGLIEALTEPTSLGVYLRERYIFKIIPMLNPDGVIVGNYRNTVSGRDANRTWRRPATENSTVVAAKELISAAIARRGVDMFIDIHGHNKKPNVFMYGVDPPADADPTSSGSHPNVFPFILSRLCDYFSYKDCNFYVPPCKLGTARVVVARDLGIPLSYTLEASFLGPMVGEFARSQFTMNNYLNLGRYVLEAIARMGCSQTLDRYIAMAGVLREEASEGSDDANATSSGEGESFGTVGKLQGVLAMAGTIKRRVKRMKKKKKDVNGRKEEERPLIMTLASRTETMKALRTRVLALDGREVGSPSDSPLSPCLLDSSGCPQLPQGPRAPLHAHTTRLPPPRRRAAMSRPASFIKEEWY